VSSPPLLDTSVLLRHVLSDSPTLSPKATTYFRRIERGEVTVRLSDTVIFEAVFTLEKFYRVPRFDIRDNLLDILRLPGVVIPGKRSFRRVFDLYVSRRSISFADCYHAVLAQRLGVSEVVSFDRDFDRLPGVTRIEPS
jgi:predicted nucleic acid-binding protein